MTKRMRWDIANKRDKVAMHTTTTRIPVRLDEAFWKAWRENPDAMRADGYRVQKVGGKWRAWIERKGVA